MDADGKMISQRSDWNRDHEDDEIFVGEDYDENGDLKLYIEDDYVIIAE